MKTILFTNRYTGVPLEIVQSVVPEGFEIRFLSEQTQAALCRELSGADYLLAGGRLKIDGAVLAGADRLQMIQRSGVGLDSLDLDDIRERGIPLFVNQGVNTESVSEHTLLLILACLRHLTIIHENTRNGIWKKQEQGVQTAELKGKTVGIVGMGNSGRALVHLLQPFQVRIIYYSRNRKEAVENECGIQYVSLEELLSQSDVVSLNCSLNADTRRIINAGNLNRMKTGAILINTARGGLVDTHALADALRSGKLSFAGIDVHEEEPIPEDDPLKRLENVILTPHIAGITADSFRAMMHDAFRNIAAFDRGDLEAIAPYRYL